MLAVNDYLAGIGLDELHDELADRRLAAAGFADETERLAFVYREGHAVDGLDVAHRALEKALFDGEVLF